MPEASATFFDHSKQVALKFLQTVVVVDDRAKFGPEEQEADKPTGGLTSPNPETLILSTDTEVKYLPVSAEEFSHRLNAKELIDAFASHGLVCAVLKPTAEEISDTWALKTKTAKAAHRADIVVLDWRLNNDQGEHALKVIEHIVSADENEHRLRLICIYTGETELRGKITRVETALKVLGVSAIPSEEFTVTNGRVRVVIYAKEETSLPDDQKSRIKTIKELPDVLVGEFAMMTSGLVSNTAVASLAAVRENTHRLLLKIKQSLDAPMLAHRAMLPDPTDAPDQVTQLITEEIRSIVLQSGVANESSIENIKLWLDLNQDVIHLQSLSKDANNATAKGDRVTVEQVSTLLTQGCDGESLPPIFGNIKKKPYERINAGIFSKDANPDLLDKEFAVLTSSESLYVDSYPYLGLGFVLARLEAGTSTYWLCMQPICDSVRITETERAFPLLHLKHANEGDRIDIVVKDDSGFLQLKVDKAYKGLLVPFAPDPIKKAVVARQFEDIWYFQPIEGELYRCVAMLKQEVAQDFANKNSGELARIALNPPEWQRRRNEKK